MCGRPLTFAGIGLGLLLLAGPVLAEEHCHVPFDQWQSRSAVRALAKSHSWVIRRIKTDDGCYVVHGRDEGGREMEIRLDPQTLAIIDTHFDQDRDFDPDDKPK